MKPEVAFYSGVVLLGLTTAHWLRQCALGRQRGRYKVTDFGPAALRVIGVVALLIFLYATGTLSQLVHSIGK